MLYGNNVSVGKYVASGDANIYYETYGQGEPVVLLHGGLMGTPAEMGQLADKLRSTYCVILIATRGHGRSTIGHGTPSYEQKAADVKAVLDGLGITKAFVIGFSDGAYTGYFLAAHYPAYVQKLVAIGAGIWPKGFIQGGRRQIHSFADLRALAPDYWQEQLEDVRPEPKRVEKWVTQTLQYYDTVEVTPQFLQGLEAKTLLIAGEKDENAPLSTVIEAYQALPHASLGIIPGAPHTVLFSQFEVVWLMIESFLHS